MVTGKVCTPWQKLWIISAGIKSETDSISKVTLGRFDTRLRGLFDASSLGYLLLVCGEDLTRFLLRRELEKVV